MGQWFDRVRRSGLLACLVLLAAVIAPAAGATGIETLPPPSPRTFVGVCAFPVLVEAVESDQKGIQWDGGAMTFGKLVLRLTNTDAGRAVIVDVSGPATYKGSPESYVGLLMGRWLLAAEPGELRNYPDGLLVLTNGLVVERFDPASGLTWTRKAGQWRNVCDVLTVSP